tara:strand:+ start:536 stop:826 length:291 start_codon:yes stop_codon:yes gene_type:complete
MATRTIIDTKSGYMSEFVTEDDKNIYHSSQNVQPILDNVKNLSEVQNSKELKHVAEIPMVIYQKAIREGWSKDKKKWKKWLNDPDNKLFRIWPGRV